MREFSLHILDLVENSIRAGASIVAIAITEDTRGDRLDISVEDNGKGLEVGPERVVDPFYTTKGGKSTGFGLSLFRTAVEQSGGGLTITASSLGGLAVCATMQLSHIDRAPVGNLTSTVSGIICANPHLDLRCRYRVNGREYNLRSLDMIEHACSQGGAGPALSRSVSEQMKKGLREIGAKA